MNAATEGAGTGGWSARWSRWRGVAAREPVLVVATVAALALYYLTPSPLVALLPLGAYVVLAWLRLDIALTTLPLAFPYWFVPKRVAGHAVFPLSEIALGVCVAVALGHELRQVWRRRSSGGAGLARTLGRARQRLGGLARWVGWPLALGALLLIAGATLGLIVARRPAEALRAWRWEIAEPLIYCVLVLLYARGTRNLRRLLWSLLGAGLVLALLATAQIAFWHVTFTPLAQGNQLIPLRPDGAGLLRATAFVYGSGNSLGAALERALPLGLALALMGRGGPLPALPAHGEGRERMARAEGTLVAGPQVRRGGGRQSGGVWVRVAGGLICLALLPALIWSQSRGAWVGAVLGVLVVVCLALGRPWWLAVAGALGGAIALWQRDKLLALVLAGHDATGQLRLLIWLAAWHMIRDHPLLGIGLDQFLYYYSNLYTNHPYWITSLNGQPTNVWTQPDLAHPHNLALDLWLSVGLLGLVGFGTILAVVWGRCWRLWRLWWAGRSARAGGTAGLGAVVALGAGASILAGVAHGMVDSAYFEPDLALMFWASVALVLLAQRVRVSKSSGVLR